MTTMAYVILGALGVMTVLLVFGAAKLERRATEWQWLHPPNEDEDGVFLMEEDDDPDGQNSR